MLQIIKEYKTDRYISIGGLFFEMYNRNEKIESSRYQSELIFEKAGKIMIKTVSLKCPECNANLEIEEGRKRCFCQYCGTKIMLDDGSCTYTVRGCTDPNANNYNSSANENDGSCTYTVMGCTDSSANNYNSNANTDDGSCTYDVKGCMDKNATNYNEKATVDDKSCIQKKTTDNNISYDYNNNSKESTDGGFVGGLGIMTLLSSVGAIIYAKKKKK